MKINSDKKRCTRINPAIKIMKMWKLGLMALMILNLASCKSAKTPKVKDAFIAQLQDTKDGWTETGDAMWGLNMGVLTGQGGVGYIVSEDIYTDFVLEAEFFPDAVVNSGIFLRCPKDEQSATGCYEINIWDDHVNQDFRTGAIVTHGKPLAHINSVGKWNQYKIVSIADHISVWLNGVKTSDLHDTKTKEGFIAFQVNGEGVIKFRNIRISKY